MIEAARRFHLSDGISLLLGILFLGVVTVTAPAVSASDNIYQRLSSDPQFSDLVKTIDATNAKELYVGGTRTVFAPTNDAYAKLSAGERDEFLSPKGENVINNIRAFCSIRSSRRGSISTPSRPRRR